MNAEQMSKQWSQIIAKAWRDESFKKRLLADPAATLKAEGVELPAGVQVRAVEDTDTVYHLVVPPKPAVVTPPDAITSTSAAGRGR